MQKRTGHGSTLSYYDIGRTTVQVCEADPRFSYCAYVPESYDEKGTERLRLLVVVHGTRRDNATCRDDFIDLAERHRLVVLAPLFPAGITAPRELSSYKRLRGADGEGPAYDLLLLSMVEELSRTYRLDAQRFLLFGFSGGGHFAHRFLYAHPQRLAAVSIGAPGIVTLLDPQTPWLAGTGGFDRVFGKPLDLAALRRVAVHMVVGGDDTDTWEIAIPAGHPWWQPAFDTHGSTRIERMQALKASLLAQGVAVRHDVVPGASHQQTPLLPAVKSFFSACLSSAQA
ncbi:MAG: alpha/beta hydrolase [Comamonadaceae bacterium]|nr:MAG: alpha/beta hydrolase [Comamonadaceae bacterium]